VNAEDYIPTSKLFPILERETPVPLEVRYFRSNVIGQLRDKGVIIASSAKGYKIPCCVNDIMDFVDLSHTMIHPMIERVRKTRNQLLLATKKDLDIVKNEKYEYLRKLLGEDKADFGTMGRDS